MQEEDSPGGIIDTISEALARHAEMKQARDNNRSQIEAAIGTRVAASSAAIEATRDSLSAGIKKTRELEPVESKKSLKAAASLTSH